MSSTVAYGGDVLLADTSAWTHARHSSVCEEWAAALANDQIATCPIVQLEILVSARDGDAFDAVADLLVAACAQDAAVAVLHYDEDFDRLATVLRFESRWIAPRASLAS